MTFFFALHLTLRRNLDICGHIDDFFCSSLDFARKIGPLQILFLVIISFFFSANCHNFFVNSWLDSLLYQLFCDYDVIWRLQHAFEVA